MLLKPNSVSNFGVIPNILNIFICAKTMDNIPTSEFDEVLEFIAQRSQYLNFKHIEQLYCSYHLPPITTPFSAEILFPVKRALQENMGLSVIRIGDGEANLLTFGAYPATPHLNNYVVKKIISMQQDSFEVSEDWNVILRDLMMGAVAQADIVGVLGFWRSPPYPTIESILQQFYQDPRGMSGQWRAIDYMLHLAREGMLQNKLITSAHLYFSVLEHMDDLIPLAKKVLIISDKATVVQKLQRKYPTSDFDYIAVGTTTEELRCSATPIFLSQVFSSLPLGMNGYLCFVGAGPWAEIYCTWIKQRGGVGIDLGSGFDLLEGIVTRPVHRKVGVEKVSRYKL